MLLAAIAVVNQGKVEMGVLSTAVKSIVDTLEQAARPIQDATGHLTRSLSLIEIALALAAVLMGAAPMHLLRKVMTVATWLSIIDLFHDAAKALMKFFVQAAGNAFGGTSDLLLQPSKILGMATKATEPILHKLLDMNIAMDFGTGLLLGLVLLLIMIAYIALALSIALGVIEFYLYLSLSGLLLPFAVFGHTRFLADKAINVVIACAIKLAVISFIVSAVEPILASIKFEAGVWNSLTWHSVWALLVVVGLCCSLALWAPRLAAGFLHGSPSLSGTAVVAQAAAVGAAMVGAGVQAAANVWGAAQGSYTDRIPSPSAQSPIGAGVTGASAAAPAPPLIIFYAGEGNEQSLQAPAAPQFPAGDEPRLLSAGGDL
jgi:type IV secretion system protein TrbL